MKVASQLHTALVREVQERYNVNLTHFLSLTDSQRKEIDSLMLRALDGHGLRELSSKFPVLAKLEERNALQAVRTVLNYTAKVKRTASKNQVDETIQGFEERNQECRRWAREHARATRSVASCFRHRGPDGSRCLEYTSALLVVARQLVKLRLSRYKCPGKPSHGPGVTTNAGSVQIDKYAVLERDVPPSMLRFADYFVPSPSYAAGFHPIGGAPVECKLSAVPKDFRGPRLIAPHSVQHMWMQQAVSDRVTELLVRAEKWYRYHPLLGQKLSTIQFDDQLCNAALALYGSTAPRMYGTIDLSDASDRIPWLLVWTLCPRHLRKDLAAVRARCYTHDGEVRKLYMHAPMGSACCFPILSVVAWATCVAAIWLDRMSLFPLEEGESGVCDLSYLLRMMRSRLVAESDAVWVFGDDIVIPPEAYGIVVRALAAFNMKVNANKSYCDVGGFRESCGCDAYRGVEITPLRLRVDGVSSVAGLLTLVEHSNALYREGYLSTREECNLLIEVIADQLGVRHLIGASTDPCLTSCVYFQSISSAEKWNRNGGVVRRYNRNLQRAEIRVLRVEANQVHRVVDIDSRGRLFEGVLGRFRKVPAESRLLSGWTGNRPRLSVAWLPFW